MTDANQDDHCHEKVKRNPHSNIPCSGHAWRDPATYCVLPVRRPRAIILLSKPLWSPIPYSPPRVYLTAVRKQ